MKVYAVFNDRELISIHRTLSRAQEDIVRIAKAMGYTEDDIEKGWWNADKTSFLIPLTGGNYTAEEFTIWMYPLKD